jgi:hypothetical protein
VAGTTQKVPLPVLIPDFKTMNLMMESESPPWVVMPLTNTLLLCFEGFCSSALSYLTNLRALELSGRTLQVGSTIPTVESQPFSEMATLRGVDIEEPEANNVDPVWRSVHCNTLENLLRVIFRYYRGVYLFPTLQTHFARLQEEDMDYVHYLHGIGSVTKEQDLPNDAVVTKNDRDYTPLALNIQALGQLATDDLVEYFYDDPDISCDVIGWGQ